MEQISAANAALLQRGAFITLIRHETLKKKIKTKMVDGTVKNKVVRKKKKQVGTLFSDITQGSIILFRAKNKNNYRPASSEVVEIEETGGQVFISTRFSKYRISA